MKYVDELSVALARKFPDRTASQYKSVILNGWKLREKEERQMKENAEKGVDRKVKLKSRYVRILRPDISYVDLKNTHLSVFNQRSNRSRLIARVNAQRPLET